MHQPPRNKSPVSGNLTKCEAVETQIYFFASSQRRMKNKKSFQKGVYTLACDKEAVFCQTFKES